MSLFVKRPPGNRTKRIIFTEDEIEYMLRRYAEIRSLTSLEQEMGITAGIIKRQLLKHGVKLKKTRKTEEQIEAVRNDYFNSDLDMKQICIKHDISKSLVTKLAKRHEWTRLVWTRKYFAEVWSRTLEGKALESKINEAKAKQSARSSGSGNPMYGKPSPQGAGNGWKGWYKGHYFRSLREACFMIRMDEEGREWRTGETLSIRYLDNGTERTYRPDFIVGTDVYEIKPLKLQKTLSVRAKATAGEAYCKEHGMTYHLIDETVLIGHIGYAFATKAIKFARDYAERFVKHTVKNLWKLHLPVGS